MKRTKLKIVCLALAIITLSACSKAEFTPKCDGSTPTYDAEIKTIIDANCNSSSCHGTGSSRGDFTTYAGLEPDLTNGKFEKEVLTRQSMPQGSATLTQTQLILIRCWADNGYPEN